MPTDPPNTPEPDDPPLTEAEAALLRFDLAINERQKWAIQ